MAYLGNTHTNEFHDLTNPNGDCQIGEINHHVDIASINAGLAAGWDPCDWCMPQVLSAHITVKPGPTIERAQTLTLDGSHSRPRRGPFKVQKYQWTITPDDGHGVTITSTEPTLSFVALGDVTAELVVTNTVNGQTQTNTKDKDVHAKPRTLKAIRWAATTTGSSNGTLVDGYLNIGHNTCAIEADSGGDQIAGHDIHHGEDEDASWADEYTRTQVPDDDPGPWASQWYIEQTDLFVQRAELISIDLLTTSDLYQTNQAAGHQADVDTLAASVRAHEHYHTQIIRGRFSGHATETPKALEQLITDNEDDLITQADQEISQFETTLQGDTAADEATVHQLMQQQWAGTTVTLLIHDGAGGYTQTTLPDLSTLGD